ncbi:hypothetical protein [Treponema vincentii]|uniref:hypothetical protein n=1 Tax=Treponema vincentii TaxID=69710 RepID=UPI0020A4B298|nr:hypothetical protein [Treponema vincentii]UTC47749.1 hypothetical protein E4N73_02285 [Treponema vincentii]
MNNTFLRLYKYAIVAIVGIAINKHCIFKITLKKTSSKEVIGMTIVIGGDTDDKEEAEMLFVLYAITKAFNPEYDYKEIAAFISDLSGAKSRYEIYKFTF